MKKALLTNTFLMALTMLYAGNVCAQEKAKQPSFKKEILFKIHDIKPNKDEQGFVKDCGYSLTVYNRTDTDMEAATLDLSWNDNDGNQLVEQDIVTDDEGKQKFDGRMKTKNKVISSFVDIPRTSAYEQVTLDLTAKTEKCYLLLGDVKYRVTSCKLIDKEILDTDKKAKNRKKETCANMFKFVSVTNPEYYKEFQPVSHEDQAAQAEQQKVQELDKIENINNEILKNFDETKSVLSEIK